MSDRLIKDHRKGVALIWKVGENIALRVGFVHYEADSEEMVIRVPVGRQNKSKQLDDFPEIDDAINKDRLVLLRLLKRMRKAKLSNAN